MKKKTQRLYKETITKNKKGPCKDPFRASYQLHRINSPRTHLAITKNEQH